jgi:hypothetical protein
MSSRFHRVALPVAVRGGLGLGQQQRVGDTHLPQRRPQQTQPVFTPDGGVGDRHPLRRGALLRADPVEHPARHVRGDGVRMLFTAVDDQRDRITDPTFELPHQQFGITHRATLRGLTHQHRPVPAEPDHRRTQRGAVAELDELRAPDRPCDRGGGVGRADVNAKLVGHLIPSERHAGLPVTGHAKSPRHSHRRT